MWYPSSASALAGAVFFGVVWYNRNSIKNIYRLVSIITGSAKEKVFTIEKAGNGEVLSLDEAHLSVFKTSQLFDMELFTLRETEKDFMAEFNINIPHGSQSLPLTQVRVKNSIGYCPIRPIDFGLETFYFAIKYLNEDLYFIYRFDKNEYLNLKEMLGFYKKDFENEKSKPKNVVLAEAFD